MKMLNELRSKIPHDTIREKYGTEIAGPVRGPLKLFSKTCSKQVLERIGTLTGRKLSAAFFDARARRGASHSRSRGSVESVFGARQDDSCVERTCTVHVAFNVAVLLIFPQ